MKTLKNLMTRLVREDDGAAASEYAVLVALIVAAVALAVTQFNLSGIYTAVNTAVRTAMGITS